MSTTYEAPSPEPALQTNHLEIQCWQKFPDFLRDEETDINSLSMIGVELFPGKFDHIASAGRLLLGLWNITSLKIENIPNVPRVLLASCVQLTKLEIGNVDFVNDASSASPRPQLKALICTGLEDTTFVKLLSIVDVTRLRFFECELKGEGASGEKGPQLILDQCRDTLQSLTLRSDWVFQSAPEDYRPWRTTVCDLSQQYMLNQLTFTSRFDPDMEGANTASPRVHVLDQVLSTISSRTSMLQSIECKVSIPLDHALQYMFERDMKLGFEYYEPLDLFRRDGWRGLDRTLARVVNERQLRVLVNVTGVMSAEFHDLYDPLHLLDDRLTLWNFMDSWGKQVFVEVGKLRNFEFIVDGRVSATPDYRIKFPEL